MANLLTERLLLGRPDPPDWTDLVHLELAKLNISLSGRNREQLRQLPLEVAQLSPRSQFLCVFGLDDCRIRDPVDRMIGRALELDRFKYGPDAGTFRDTDSRTESLDSADFMEPTTTSRPLFNPNLGPELVADHISTEDERRASHVVQLCRARAGRIEIHPLDRDP